MKSLAVPLMLFTAMLFASCAENSVETVMGLKPVYGSLNDLNTIITNGETNLENPGKIYVMGDLLFVNEAFKGVHVFDNSDPSNPTKKTFIAIPGNMDVTIVGDHMYADYLQGIVTIDISDIYDVHVISYNNEIPSIENAQNRPPSVLVQKFGTGRVYYECADDSKGLVIDWEEVQMPKPNCFIDSRL